jgi:predicted acylesterase/phospholipase RssA
MSNAVIKHLVLSGGGPSGLVTYGAAKHLAQSGLWQLANIQSMYGCSIGAYFAVVLSLNYEWSWLDDYYIKRPWEKLIKITGNNFMNIFTEKGLVGEEVIRDSLAPLLIAKDLAVNITLAELYAYNSIDIHMYSVNINTDTLSKVDISHTTHPTLPVVQALWRSMAFPFLIKPVCIGPDCFIDGGLLNNFPLQDCLDQNPTCGEGGCEILAFKNVCLNKPAALISTESSLVDFLVSCITKLTLAVDTEHLQPVLPNVVNCCVENGKYSTWLDAISTQEARQKLVENGEAFAADFLKTKTLA